MALLPSKMQKRRKVQSDIPSEEMLARPPPIEVLAAEGFAQDPRLAPRLPFSPTVSLSEVLADGFFFPQGTQAPRPVQSQSSSSSAPAAVASLGPMRLPQPVHFAAPATADTPQFKAVAEALNSKSAALPSLRRTATTSLGCQQFASGASTLRPALRRTNTAPPGGCTDIVSSSLQRHPLLPLAGQADAASKPVLAVARPVLRLPLPARSIDAAGSPSNAALASPMEKVGLPAVSNLAASAYANSRRLHAAKTKALPARLRAIDDQTTIPVDVHNKMMVLGGQARGAFGYGQHRLQFAESTGKPVLRLIC